MSESTRSIGEAFGSEGAEQIASFVRMLREARSGGVDLGMASLSISSRLNFDVDAVGDVVSVRFHDPRPKVSAFLIESEVQSLDLIGTKLTVSTNLFPDWEIDLEDA